LSSERIVIAIRGDSLRQNVVDILSKSGLQVRASVRSGAEAIRAVRIMGGGVVICSPQLSDCRYDTLVSRMGESAYFLVIAHPASLNAIDGADVFRVSLPVMGPELVGSVRILTQLDQQRRDKERRVPVRSDKEKEIISQAKAYLIDDRGMSEDEAHRFLQKRSMDTATPITEIARMILYHSE